MTSRGTTLVARAVGQIQQTVYRLREPLYARYRAHPERPTRRHQSSFSPSAPRRVSAGAPTASHRPAALCQSALRLLLLFIALPICIFRYDCFMQCVVYTIYWEGLSRVCRRLLLFTVSHLFYHAWDLVKQRRQVFANGSPEHPDIDAEVGVYHFVAHGYHFPPRHIGVLFTYG